MLSIGNKTFMNLQEAVGWLLENNALPFQSTANYAGGVEIAMSTLINPSPAKVRVGSIIFFADSKVSTVVGVTSNSFIVSDQYNDLVDDIVYVSNVAINASGHLIVTLSNGTDIDAGLIKQVSNFSINASQHLIVTYNDGSTTDLGAIFNGNVNIAGNFTADSIIENMTGYSFTPAGSIATNGITLGFVGVTKTGNKVTFAIAGIFDSTKSPSATVYIGNFTVPRATVGDKLVTTYSNFLDVQELIIYATGLATVKKPAIFYKSYVNEVGLMIYNMNSGFDGTSTYYFRYEVTFLLGDNLAS